MFSLFSRGRTTKGKRHGPASSFFLLPSGLQFPGLKAKRSRFRTLEAWAPLAGGLQGRLRRRQRPGDGPGPGRLRGGGRTRRRGSAAGGSQGVRQAAKAIN